MKSSGATPDGEPQPEEAPPENGSEVELISDADGIAVVGDPDAVDAYIASLEVVASRDLDLTRLRRLLGASADLAGVAAEINANAGRWIKLTKESARRVAADGLMESKRLGERHIMIGEPGELVSWLQAEDGVSSILTNPAVLAGVSSLMAQAAARHNMSEIASYLASIDAKLTDVERKIDASVTSQLGGVAAAIQSALERYDATGAVSRTSWSTIDQAPTIIGRVQDYALSELDAIADQLSATKGKELAAAIAGARASTPHWLAIVGRCTRLHDAVELLQSQREVAETPDQIAEHNDTLRRARAWRRAQIAAHTHNLLARTEQAAGTANARIIRDRARSLEVLGSANVVAAELEDFHVVMSIVAETQAWTPRELGGAAKIGSIAIQHAREAAPVAAAGVGVVAVGAKLAKSSRPAIELAAKLLR